MRRRLHFLRKARELAYRDLGGLVFDLHRFGQRHDELVVAKLATLTHIDAELRALEGVLEEHQSLAVLREAGIAACPRCAAIHGSDDRFCPSCGMPVGVEGPLTAPAGAPMLATPTSEAPQPVQPPLRTPPQSPQPPPNIPPQPAPPPSSSPFQPPAQDTSHPGQSSPFSARWGSTATPSEDQSTQSDLVRKASEKHGGEEDQPTQILDGEQRPRVGEQPTQGFDSSSASG